MHTPHVCINVMTAWRAHRAGGRNAWEAGVEPDATFQMLQGKRRAVSYLPAAYRAKHITAQHKADLWTQAAISASISDQRLQEG